MIAVVARREFRAMFEDQMWHRIGPRLQALEWSELDRTRRSQGQCIRLVAPIGEPLAGEDPVAILQYWVYEAYGLEIPRCELAGCHRSSNKKTIVARFNFNGPSSLVSLLTTSESVLDGVYVMRMQVRIGINLVLQ